MFRLLILPLVLLLGTAPTVQALCLADCVGTVPRDRAAGPCHDAAGAGLRAPLPEECSLVSLDDATLPATPRESGGAPVASPGLPIGTPALDLPRGALHAVWRGGHVRPPDARPLETTLRI